MNATDYAYSNKPDGDARRGNWMQTYTGQAFYPLDPRPEEIAILAAAEAEEAAEAVAQARQGSARNPHPPAPPLGRTQGAGVMTFIDTPKLVAVHPLSGPTHVMLDLETWGTAPGCDIRSIGAVVFDPIDGCLGEGFYLNLRGGSNFGLTQDPSTVAWWERQTCAARNVLDIDRRFIVEGLTEFSTWFTNLVERPEEVESIRLWSKGPHFDEAILAAAYRAIGEEVPWHYRAPRDCRTIEEAAGGVDVVSDGTQHNALDDAMYQARCVIEAYRKLLQLGDAA